MPNFDLLDGGAAAEQERIQDLIKGVAERSAAWELPPAAAIRARVDWGDGGFGTAQATGAGTGTRRGRRWSGRRVVTVCSALAAAAVAVALLAVALPSDPPPHTAIAVRPLPWRLASAITPADQGFTPAGTSPTVGTNQALDGISCPTTTVCYATMQTEESQAIDPSFFHSVTGDSIAPGTTATYSMTTGAFVSQDAGSSWTQIALPSGLSLDTRLTCPSATTCMAGAQAGKPNGWDDVRPQLFLVTHDAGVHWSQETLPMRPVTGIDPQLDPSIASLQGSVTQLTCFTLDTCVAFGQVPSDQPIGGLSGTGLAQAEQGSEATVMRTVFMRTDDGGARWSTFVFPWSATPTGAPGASNAQPATFSCPSENSCVGVQTVLGSMANATTSSGTGLFSSLVLRTNDGGTNWTSAWPASESTLQSLTVYPTLSCADALHCQSEVVTRTGQADALGIISTADGGSTWQVHTVLNGEFGQWWGMTCPSVEDCWAVGGTYVGTNSTPGSAFIIATHDGGQTWTPVALPSGTNVVQAISCPTSTACFALAGSESSATGPLTNAAVLTNAPPG